MPSTYAVLCDVRRCFNVERAGSVLAVAQIAVLGRRDSDCNRGLVACADERQIEMADTDTDTDTIRYLIRYIRPLWYQIPEQTVPAAHGLFCAQFFES
jgi:hypothetical protein